MSREAFLAAAKRGLEKASFVDLSSPIEWLSTGLKDLDAQLGNGIVSGSLVEVSGQTQVGKSSLLYYMCGKFQEKGLSVLWLDYERAFNKFYAQKLGLKEVENDSEKFTVFQPQDFEEAEHLINLVLNDPKDPPYNVIVIDSLAAMKPRAFKDAIASEQSRPLLAQLMSRALGNWVGKCNEKKVTIFFINHLKEEINMGGRPMFGPKLYYSPASKTLRFYANIKLQLFGRKFFQRQEKDKTGTPVKTKLGQLIRVYIEKNRHAPPYRNALVGILFGQGVYDYEAFEEAAKNYSDVEVKDAEEAEIVENAEERAETLELDTPIRPQAKRRGRPAKVPTFAETQEEGN